MTPKKSHNPKVNTANDDGLLNEAAGGVIETPKPSSEQETKEPPKPIIPGLPEVERLKQVKMKKKKPKKKKSQEEKTQKTLSKSDFLISPGTGLLKNKEELAGFEFSDYEEDANDSEVSDDEFEDTRESISDTETSSVAPDFLTPVQRGRKKRSASSPADAVVDKKDNKKVRAQSHSRILKK